MFTLRIYNIALAENLQNVYETYSSLSLKKQEKLNHNRKDSAEISEVSPLVQTTRCSPPARKVALEGPDLHPIPWEHVSNL